MTKKPKIIKMTRKAAIKEHTKLIKVLKTKNKKGIKEEIKDQSAELKKWL